MRDFIYDFTVFEEIGVIDLLIARMEDDGYDVKTQEIKDEKGEVEEIKAVVDEVSFRNIVEKLLDNVNNRNGLSTLSRETFEVKWGRVIDKAISDAKIPQATTSFIPQRRVVKKVIRPNKSKKK